MYTHVLLALLSSSIAVRVRNLSALALLAGDDSMDETQDRDGTEGDGDDGTMCVSMYRVAGGICRYIIPIVARNSD
jgi:hypothetical protein